MTFYFVMTNSWSLLYDEMYGPDDEANLLKWKEEQLARGLPMTDDVTGITEYPPDYMYRPPYPDYSTADEDLFASMDGVDSLTLNTEDPIKEIMTDSRNKYHEKEILHDVEEYVSRTYNGHYTGTKHEYRNVQTIDLMASRDLASDFCQANILKYGSRYGSKDGRNKKDLMKVIHYAMLLLHFDEHYGKPKMTSGNIDHTMP